MKPIIFFDLDGTILDVSERIYRVYSDILKKHDQKALNKKEYLRLKKSKVSVKDILERTKAENILNDFKKEWLENIEKIKYLDMDKLDYSKRNFLNILRKKYCLILLTSRTKKNSLRDQLKKKKLDIFFDAMIACPEGRDKSDILKRTKGNKIFFVSDTESPIMAGKKSKIKTVAVCDGLRTRAFLKKMSPDLLIKNITGLKKYV